MCVLKTSLSERLMYRGDFAFGTLMRFLPLITQIFLWGAIFGADPSRKINGYTYTEMVAYFLLTMVSRAFSSMPGLSNSISAEIRDGTLKKYLVQPIDLLGFYFFSRVAHKLVYYLVALGPYLLVFYLFRSFFTNPVPLSLILPFLLALLLAFLLGFLMESLVGLVGFWILETNSISFIFMMLTYFLSGHMLPLDWFPEPLSTWVQYLPFRYLAHFPCALLLGKYSLAELQSELAIGTVWTFFFWWLNRQLFQRGLRRYGAYGG